jgi:ferric-dicitrate binding protein FerR (iron transport regulator)
MMHNVHSSAAPRLERLGGLMRDATPPESLQKSLEGRARLIASVEKMRRPSAARAARPVAGAFVLAAAAAAIALFVVRHRAPAAIAWHVENGQVGEQGYVSIPPTAPSARLAFDDGSDVTLAPGSRGRVAATTATGAEVVLEQGRARVHVQHRDKTQWTVDAGPFAVRVTGTEFMLAWSADAGMLDVWMTAGRVVVTGPVIGESVALSGGQHIVAKLREGAVQIDSAAAPDLSTGASNTPAPSADPAPEVPTVDVAPAPVPPGVLAAGPTWPKLVAGGEYARVMKEATAEGVGHALAARPLPDLRALGDAARYVGAPDVARRAYATVRSRFPASGEARTAAFLLGRVAEEQDRDLVSALRWYDKYLAEAPGGAFAGDALGRKMVLVSKSQGRDAARPMAARYLARFPNGPYAAAAHDLAP